MKFFLISAAVLLTAVNGESDKEMYGRDVGPNDQAALTKKHNDLRQLLVQGKVPKQPKACNMATMKYDAKLGAEGQKISDTCKFEHVQVNDGRWPAVGQNLFMETTTECDNKANWDYAIQTWFDEHHKYHYPDDSSAETGHYTQVAWATTDHVGCGFTVCPAKEAFACRKFYVCNYGPGGNIRGQPPYQTCKSGHSNSG